MIKLLESDGYISRSIKNELRSNSSLAALRLFGDAVTSTSVGRFQQLVKEIKALLNNPQSLVNISERLIFVKALFEDIVEEFGSDTEDPIGMQFTLSKRNLRYGRILQAAITLHAALDAMVKSMRPPDLEGYLGKILRTFRKTPTNPTYIPPNGLKQDTLDFIKKYHDVRVFRNYYAHGLELTDRMITVEELEDYADTLSSIYHDDINANLRVRIREIFAQRIVLAGIKPAPVSA